MILSLHEYVLPRSSHQYPSVAAPSSKGMYLYVVLPYNGSKILMSYKESYVLSSYPESFRRLKALVVDDVLIIA